MSRDGGAKVPKMRFPAFAGKWEQRTLGDFFTFKNGLNAEKESYGSGRKFVNVLDIISAGPITHDSIIGSVDVPDSEFNKNEVVYGDILFQRSSETREEVGQSNVYLDDRPVTFGGFVIRGRAKAELEPRYFDALLKTPPVRKDMTSRSGGSTRYNIGQEALERVEICVAPDLDEQRKIADSLDAVAAAARLLERKEVALSAFKKAMMQRIFAQEIRFTRHDGSAFPDWIETRLGDLLDIGGGRDYSHLESGEYPVFGTGGYMTSVNDYLYDGESVCIGRKGTIDVPRFLTGRFWTVDTLFYTHNFRNLLPRFAFALFQRINWQKHNEASGVPSLSKRTIERLMVQLPDAEEQEKIAGFLSAIDAKIEAVSAQIAAMQQFKNALLHQMFV